MLRLPVEQGGASKDAVRRLTTSHQLRVLDMGTGTVTLLAEWGGSEWISLIGFSPDGERILSRERATRAPARARSGASTPTAPTSGVLLPGPLMAIGSRPVRLTRLGRWLQQGGRPARCRASWSGQVVAVAYAFGDGR